MVCPHCANNLKPVSIQNKYGQAVIVDQCENCGGLWFDEWELFPLESKEIEKIDKISGEKLGQKIFPHIGSNFCPKCNQALAAFKDPVIPSCIEMSHCKKCGGYWLNQGETLEYKQWQDKKKAQALAEEKAEATAKAMAEQHLQASPLYNFGNLLSAPIEPYHLTPLPRVGSDFPIKDYQRVSAAASIAQTILMALLKILFKI